MAREYSAFIQQSEFKKPYLSNDYQDMEYTAQLPPYKEPEPPPSISPGPVPSVPGGMQQPSPGPAPLMPPLPKYNCNGCWGPIGSVVFCPGGPPVAVMPAMNCPDDPIVSATLLSGDGSVSFSGGAALYKPGNGTLAVIEFHTSSGRHCLGILLADWSEHCLECLGVIGYTATGMNVNEQQQLTIVGGGDPNYYSWEVLSGGGSIDESGKYTAPSSNSGCGNNTIIALKCGGSIVDTLSIAVNGYANLGITAVIACEVSALSQSPNPSYCLYCFNCLGEPSTFDGAHCSVSTGGAICGGSSSFCTDSPALCNYFDWGTCATSSAGPFPHDNRTPEMIAGGCCPPQLM
jgi:hypothetical protein